LLQGKRNIATLSNSGKASLKSISQGNQQEIERTELALKWTLGVVLGSAISQHVAKAFKRYNQFLFVTDV